jgi:hypothetical protein
MKIQDRLMSHRRLSGPTFLIAALFLFLFPSLASSVEKTPILIGLDADMSSWSSPKEMVHPYS